MKKSMLIVQTALVINQLFYLPLVPAETGGAARAYTGQSFTNPIDPAGQDPWVIFKDGYYYYCQSLNDDTAIGIAKARRLQDIGLAPMVQVYTPQRGTMYSRQLWAPELHYLDKKWYIYFTASNGNNSTHRMYVLAGNTQDPQGAYTFKGKISDPADKWAIDGTVLSMDDVRRYFIWSGWEGDTNVRQNIYIARMSNPYTLTGERIELSRPAQAWETVSDPDVNEGPQILKKDGVIHIIYSASGSWTNDYCLGRLTCTNGDVLDPRAWHKSGPVFSKVNTTFGPGHASFVPSPDGTEDWIVYHANEIAGTSWPGRSIRAQKFSWDGSTPVFGTPYKFGSVLTAPAGTPGANLAVKKLEAEEARVNQASVRSSRSASAGRCVAYIDYAGSYVEFTATAARCGLSRLNVVYGNGTGAESSYQVTVNGEPARRLALPATDGWDQWAPASINVRLRPGQNIIRLAKGDSYAELDYLEVVSAFR